MRNDSKSRRRATLIVLAAGLLVGGCSGISMPNFSGGSTDTPPPPPSGGAALPSKYAPEEFVGRWGYTSYEKEADRARTINAARGLCKTPYVIAKGPTGGIMMNLAGEKQVSEMRLKGSPDGKNYIGPDGPAGDPQDQEIITFDGRLLVTRYVDPESARIYGNMVRVRCASPGGR